MRKNLQQVHHNQNRVSGEDACIMLNSLTQTQEHTMIQFPTSSPQKGLKISSDRCSLYTNRDLDSEAVLLIGCDICQTNNFYSPIVKSSNLGLFSEIIFAYVCVGR